MPITPYTISGTVTLDGSNKQGAKVYASIRGQPVPAFDEGTTVAYTNSSGQYTLDLANIAGGYSDGDTVQVVCEIGDIVTKSTHTVDTDTGSGTVDFAITEASGLTDGLSDTESSDGTGGLRPDPNFEKGTSDGMN